MKGIDLLVFCFVFRIFTGVRERFCDWVGCQRGCKINKNDNQQRFYINRENVEKQADTHQ